MGSQHAALPPPTHTGGRKAKKSKKEAAAAEGQQQLEPHQAAVAHQVEQLVVAYRSLRDQPPPLNVPASGREGAGDSAAGAVTAPAVPMAPASSTPGVRIHHRFSAVRSADEFLLLHGVLYVCGVCFPGVFRVFRAEAINRWLRARA